MSIVNNAQRRRQTDRQTDRRQHDANSRLQFSTTG